MAVLEIGSFFNNHSLFLLLLSAVLLFKGVHLQTCDCSSTTSSTPPTSTVTYDSGIDNTSSFSESANRSSVPYTEEATSNETTTLETTETTREGTTSTVETSTESEKADSCEQPSEIVWVAVLTVCGIELAVIIVLSVVIVRLTHIQTTSQADKGKDARNSAELEYSDVLKSRSRATSDDLTIQDNANYVSSLPANTLALPKSDGHAIRKQTMDCKLPQDRTELQDQENGYVNRVMMVNDPETSPNTLYMDSTESEYSEVRKSITASDDLIIQDNANYAATAPTKPLPASSTTHGKDVVQKSPSQEPYDIVVIDKHYAYENHPGPNLYARPVS